jgi:diketogulonate reductase-like aldo/keto reductase
MMVKELGRTGVMIPEVGIGTFAYRGTSDLLRQGLETGALFIDTAESYGTEAVVGEAVRGIRDRAFIATKVSPEHFHERELRDSVDASLQRLGVDVVDLVQLHHPNPAIPIQETMGALGRLVDAGKVRFCGVSNFSVDQLRAAQKALGTHPVVSNQVRYNLIDRTIESGLLRYCQEQRITVIAYSPWPSHSPGYSSAIQLGLSPKSRAPPANLPRKLSSTGAYARTAWSPSRKEDRRSISSRIAQPRTGA